jgi:hypothetical protein
MRHDNKPIQKFGVLGNARQNCQIYVNQRQPSTRYHHTSSLHLSDRLLYFLMPLQDTLEGTQHDNQHGRQQPA